MQTAVKSIADYLTIPCSRRGKLETEHTIFSSELWRCMNYQDMGQQTNTGSKSTIETLKKGVEYVQN